MLSSYLTMQNAMMAQNNAQARMISASDRMMSSVNFGASQPLQTQGTIPSFSAAQADSFELQNKADETKLGKDIKRSTPKYGGVDVQA